MPMDLDRLRLLLDVVKAGSFSRMAVIRGVPQSWVSRQIAILEAECGGLLLDRTGRGVVLSQLGKDTLPLMEAVVAQGDTLRCRLKDHAGSPRGKVSVGLLPSFVQRVAGRLFADVRRELPNVGLQITEASSVELEARLAQGELDLGVVTRKVAGKDVEVVQKRVPLYLVGKDDAHTARPTVPFALLGRVPLVLPSAGSGMRSLIDDVARKHGIEFRIAMESSSFAVQLALASSGAAYAVLGSYAVSHAVTHNALRASRIVRPTIERSIGIVSCRIRQPSVASRGVARLLRTILLEVVSTEAEG